LKAVRSHALPGLALVALAAAMTLAAGCSDKKNNVLDPAFQPEVANNIDNFQFQATGVTSVTQVLDYPWRNTGTQANVDQSCSITAGSATIALRDSTGALVYSRNLADGGSFSSAAGLAGTWSIRVTLSQVRGTLNFRVQKKT
jgi:purine nucleoside permease